MANEEKEKKVRKKNNWMDWFLIFLNTFQNEGLNRSTEDFSWFAHGSFYVEGTNVLPSLLHKRDKEVNGHGNVLSDLFLWLFDISNSSAETCSFLWLEFDSVPDFCDFIKKSFSFTQSDREFSKLDKDITQKFCDLLGNWVRSEKNIILFAPFFYFSLIFVESFQTVNINVWNIVSGSFFNMSSIG